MYQDVGGVAGAGTTMGLAATGADIVWVLLAGFALLAAGLALGRIVPKRRRSTLS